MSWDEDAYYDTSLDVPSGKFGKLIAIPGGPGPTGPPGPPGPASTVPGPPGPTSLASYGSLSAFPATGDAAKVFLAQDTGDTYRWDGTKYVRISERVKSTGIQDSTVVGRALVTAVDERSARAVLGSPLFIDVASQPYGVTPAMASPEVKIQEAIDFAAANGIPEVIISRPGTYTVGLRQIPGQTSISAALWGRSNVKLTMKPGVVIKLKDQATRPSGSTQGHIVSVIDPYVNNDLSKSKTGWCVEGGVIDGNAANQTAAGTGHPGPVSVGLFLGVCRSSKVSGVKVINIWGNNTVPPGETFFFDANCCRDVAFVDCEADGSGSVNTATGFSANNSFGVKWDGCVSHDMGAAMGFTAWQCAGLRYTGCHAYNNKAHGFNSERNDDVVFAGCVSGGSSPFIDIGGSLNPNPWFTGPQKRLGNKGAGFAIHGCENVSMSGCVSTYNGYGLRVYTNQLAPLKVCKFVNVTGSIFMFSPSEVNNVIVETAAKETVPGVPGQDQIGVHITNCLAAPSNVPDYIGNYSDSPIIRYESKGASGVRYWANATGGWAYRWQFGATPAGPIPTGASIGLTTGHQFVTAGRRLNRKAVTASYIPTTQDEVIAVDTTAGEVTINLNSASLYGAGATLLIKDEAGKAGEAGKRITVAASTTQGANPTQEFIEGLTLKRITTNYGQLRVMCTGTGWVVIDTPEAVSPAIAAPAIWPSANGSTPTITAAGTAADHNLNLTAKGTGVVQAGGTQVEVKGHKHVAADVTGALSWAAVPASATATGTAGQLAYANGFIYVCVAANTWQRAPLATW